MQILGISDEVLNCSYCSRQLAKVLGGLHNPEHREHESGEKSPLDSYELSSKYHLRITTMLCQFGQRSATSPGQDIHPPGLTLFWEEKNRTHVPSPWGDTRSINKALRDNFLQFSFMFKTTFVVLVVHFLFHFPSSTSIRIRC